MNENGRRKRQNEEAGSDWITSYGDMMTLLLCFFVLIVSYSVIELEKFREAMGSMRGSIGILMDERGKDPLENAKHSVFESPKLRRELLTFSTLGPAASARRVGSRHGVEVLFERQGIRFRISDPLLFDVGQATLKSERIQVLQEIAFFVKDGSSEIKIEGHTDNTPVRSGRFQSNWELSLQRAMSVMNYLVDHEHIDPTRVWVAGYGEYKPVAPNTTTENKAKNRRVEIFLDWSNASVVR